MNLKGGPHTTNGKFGWFSGQRAKQVKNHCSRGSLSTTQSEVLGYDCLRVWVKIVMVVRLGEFERR